MSELEKIKEFLEIILPSITVPNPESSTIEIKHIKVDFALVLPQMMKILLKNQEFNNILKQQNPETVQNFLSITEVIFGESLVSKCDIDEEMLSSLGKE